MSYGQLQILMPDGTRGTFPLEKPAITIGRGAENDLRIEHPTVSRLHARLTLEGQSILLEDLGSTNGMQVGGVTLPANTRGRIAADQPFQVGAIRFQYLPPVTPQPEPDTLSLRQVSRPPAAADSTEPTGSAWLEWSKVIIPVVGGLLTACLSGVLLLFTNPTLVERIFKEATPPSPTPALLYQDEFSDPQSGWGDYSDADGSGQYVDGSYVFNVINGDFMFWANPGKTFRDVRVEVDAVQEAGPDSGLLGLMCRYQDSDNYYHFGVQLNGEYQIRKRTNGDYDILNRGRLAGQNLIRGSGQTNHLRADCVGSTLTLYVNDEKVGEVQDVTFASGDVGISASSESGLKVAFDHFKVYQP